VSTLPPDARADTLIASAGRAPLRAYWLEGLLALGLLALAVFVARALTTPSPVPILIDGVREGAAPRADQIACGPLIPNGRTTACPPPRDGLVAARDLAPGTPLRGEALKERPRAKHGEVEIAIRAEAGRTPPRAGERVLLGVVAAKIGGDAIQLPAVVLAIDAKADPAALTVALTAADAQRLAAVPKPQFLLMRPPQEPKR
jgi:hypothetical protein